MKKQPDTAPRDVYVKLPTGGLVSGNRIVIEGSSVFDLSRDKISVDYEIVITQSGLRSMVARAFTSKGRKCCDGPITVKAYYNPSGYATEDLMGCGGMTPGPLALLLGAFLHLAWCLATIPVRAGIWILRGRRR